MIFAYTARLDGRLVLGEVAAPTWVAAWDRIMATLGRPGFVITRIFPAPPRKRPFAAALPDLQPPPTQPGPERDPDGASDADHAMRLYQAFTTAHHAFVDAGGAATDAQAAALVRLYAEWVEGFAEPTRAPGEVMRFKFKIEERMRAITASRRQATTGDSNAKAQGARPAEDTRRPGRRHREPIPQRADNVRDLRGAANDVRRHRRADVAPQRPRQTTLRGF